MWLLNALLYGVLFLGWGVIVYALAVGVKGLYSRVRADRKELAEAYKEWYGIYAHERDYYSDVFENIIENIDEFNYYVDVEGVKVIRGVLSSYVDGVRSSKVVR